MDRLPVSNLPHLSQVKAPSVNECLPSTSRHAAKSLSRPNKQFNASKNGYGRCQNKQTRSREPKSLAQHLRDNVESNRNYLDDSRRTPNCFRKKATSNHGKGASLKERFLQANCQFVMNIGSDTSGYLEDPDLPIKWDLAEEVLFTCTNAELACPICLCQPTCPKITRCGHIYCWSCILHYLALSDEESRSCPICFETIKKTGKDLKSVCIINKIEYAQNDFMTFTLMKIARKSSTIALPADFECKQTLRQLERNTDPTLDLYGKIFTASPRYVSGIIEREMAELKQQLIEYEMENMPEVCFVHSALHELESRRQQLEQVSSICEQFSELMLFKDSPLPESEEYIYFYQAEDAQNLHLHSLNIRMLKHEYGELKNCPLKITGKIIEIHGESVNEDIRRRFAHLRHLPLSCEFKIAEVQFDTRVISKATLEEFAAEINNRKRNRKRKEKAQNIRDRKIEIENNKKILGIFPEPTFHLDNVADFPDYQFQMDTLVEDPALAGEMQSDLGSLQSSAEFQSSFAKMLSLGGSDFDKTLRKPKPPNAEHSLLEKLDGADDDDDAAAASFQPTMNITLSDFFDNCVKTPKRGKKKDRKKWTEHI